MGYYKKIDDIYNKLDSMATDIDSVDTKLSSGIVLSDAHVRAVCTQIRPNDTTAYTIGDVVGATPSANLEFASFGTAGQGFLITNVVMLIKTASIPTGMSGFRLHLYSTSPTAIVDNLAYNLPSGDRSKYLGHIYLGAPVDLGDTLMCQSDGTVFGEVLVGTSLYGMLETLGSYTPTALCEKEIRLFGVDA